MANTISATRNIATVLFDGTTALDFTTDSDIAMPNGVLLFSVTLKSPSTDAVFKLRNGGATAQVVLDTKDVTGGGLFHPFNPPQRLWPYVKGDEVTSGTIAIFQYTEPKER